jgi:hypothetical protein
MEAVEKSRWYRNKGLTDADWFNSCHVTSLATAELVTTHHPFQALNSILLLGVRCLLIDLNYQQCLPWFVSPGTEESCCNYV